MDHPVHEKAIVDEVKRWKVKGYYFNEGYFHLDDPYWTLTFDKVGGRMIVTFDPFEPEARDERVRELCILLSDPDLKELGFEELSPTTFQPHHYRQIATAVCENTSITSLTLVTPWLFVEEVSEAQLEGGKALERILDDGSLDEFIIITGDVSCLCPDTWEILGKAIERNTRLTTFEFVAPGEFSDVGNLAIASIVRNNTSIKSLKLDSYTVRRSRNIAPMMQAIAGNQTLHHLSMKRFQFGRDGTRASDAKLRVADRFCRGLEKAVFENVTLRSVILKAQSEAVIPRVMAANDLVQSDVQENEMARVMRGMVFMFCLREAPEDSPLTLLRGLPFQFEEFPMIRYINGAYQWVPRKALPQPDRKRKDAPGDAEGQSAAKRPK